MRRAFLIKVAVVERQRLKLGLVLLWRIRLLELCLLDVRLNSQLLHVMRIFLEKVRLMDLTPLVDLDIFLRPILNLCFALV